MTDRGTAMNAPDGPAASVHRDADEFADFYEQQHGDQVRRAYLLVRSNELANDIVHDAMVGVWRRWRELDNPGGYLNRSVLNGCRDAGRRQVTRDTVVRRLHPVGNDRADSDVLDDVLEALPFNQRAAVVLRYYLGWSTADIADALDCPANSIGPWISRALAAMRKELT